MRANIPAKSSPVNWIKPSQIKQIQYNDMIAWDYTYMRNIWFHFSVLFDTAMLSTEECNDRLVYWNGGMPPKTVQGRTSWEAHLCVPLFHHVPMPSIQHLVISHFPPNYISYIQPRTALTFSPGHSCRLPLDKFELLVRVETRDSSPPPMSINWCSTVMLTHSRPCFLRDSVCIIL